MCKLVTERADAETAAGEILNNVATRNSLA
jgi:hypothetical protein